MQRNERFAQRPAKKKLSRQKKGATSTDELDLSDIIYYSSDQDRKIIKKLQVKDNVIYSDEGLALLRGALMTTKKRRKQPFNDAKFLNT